MAADVGPAVPGLPLADLPPPSTDETADGPPGPGRGEMGATPLAGIVDSLLLALTAARPDDALAGTRRPPLPPIWECRRRPFPSEFSFLRPTPNEDAADDDERDVRRWPRRTLDAPLAMLCLPRMIRRRK